MGDERNIFLSNMPATRRDRAAALVVVGISAVLFAMRRAVCHGAAYSRSGVHCELSIRARHQRSDHGRFVVFAICPAPVAGSVVACERLPVHRGRSHRPRPVLPGRILSDRTSQFGPANNSLALPDLAQWISASGDWLRIAEGQGWRSQNQRVSRPSAVRQRHRRRCYAVGRDLDRDRRARHPPHASERRAGALHLRSDRNPVDRVVSQLRGAADPVVPAATLGARHLAHGRDVRLVVRHRVVGRCQRGQVRSWLLRRPSIRAVRCQFRAGGPPGRQCRPAGQAGSSARSGPPASRFREKSPHRRRKPFQRGRGIVQRRHHHQIAGRHHYRLERSRRTPVRLHGSGGDRQEHQHHRPSGPARRRSAKSSSGSTAASRSNFTRPRACTRTAAASMFR